MTPEQVAANQRARLEAAMIEAVARHGYAAVTLRELVGLAGVSKQTFYQHFESKQDCFLATFDAIVTEALKRVGGAYRAQTKGDFRERLLAALHAFMDLVVQAPEAAALVGVESLTLGSAGVGHRERGSEPFEEMVKQSFQHSRSRIDVSETMVRAVVGGWRGVVYHRLRDGREGELPGLVPELVDWALCYQRRPSAALNAAVRGVEDPVRVAVEDRSPVPLSEPASSKRSRAELTQRERILRGAAQVVVDKGYDALSIPTISAAAGTSNQTFYEHFESKRDAFLAAFDLTASSALRYCAAAFAAGEGRPEAVGTAIRGLLDYISTHELFARLAFFEVPTAGPVALDRADETLKAFNAYLRPPLAPEGIGGPVSDVVMEAIGTGTWVVLQYEIAHGRREQIADVGPDLCAVALAPFAAANRR
ncbi:MAG TPA: TetR/AcrR family transcriptional regulator [Solirubrobacterales bacterium]|nr:TetR/AcrR family transcriptional regulator [Solirubrobacterales bacterium]